jgi:pyridoxamine 5'-phosphate oxidase family protein
MFTEKESSYINSQPLARLATISKELQPDASPVGFEFDGKDFYITGRNLAATRKYKNVEDGYQKVALIIDDLESIEPWKPRGIRIFGTAEIIERSGKLGSRNYLHIVSKVSWSWNIEGPAIIDGKFLSNKTIHNIEPE